MREILKQMLNNLINDKQEEATLDFHNYAHRKMQEVFGIAPKQDTPDQDDQE